MERLIRAGVDPFIYQAAICTSPVRAAASKGHLGVVQVLVDLVREYRHVGFRNYDLPLIDALIFGHIDIARFLISRGALPDVPLYRGRTTLSWIAEWGPPSSVQFLLEETTSDIEARDSKGFTPLLYTGSHGVLEVVKCLINAGADPTVRDNQGKNIIFHAAHRNYADVCIFLLGMECSNDLLNNIDAMSLAHIASL